MKSDDVERFIDTLRDSFHGAEVVYTQGSCYRLYLMLAVLRPDAVPMFDPVEGHVYTLIDGNYYDIRGKHDGVGLVPLFDELPYNADPLEWKYNIRNF